MEQAALSNCRLALYSSEWAADTAIKNYDVDPRKIGVVPFGANIQCERTAEDINRIAIGKDFKTCRLLFIGAEWSRKGGDIAVKTAQLLNQRGTKTELHCVGCDPPCDVPDFVKLHGFLSKATEKGRNALDELFRDCHFLVLPTRADCVPMVLAEASSFGLPSLTTKVGGISTAVRDGYNGQTFSLDDGAEQYSDFIAKALSSRHDFEKLSLSSFMEYTERLNWSFAGRKVRDLIRGIL